MNHLAHILIIKDILFTFREEKTEYNVELQEELEEYKAETQKLRNEVS